VKTWLKMVYETSMTEQERNIESMTEQGRNNDNIHISVHFWGGGETTKKKNKNKTNKQTNKQTNKHACS
jgi:hypothetical protein